MCGYKLQKLLILVSQASEKHSCDQSDINGTGHSVQPVRATEAHLAQGRVMSTMQGAAGNGVIMQAVLDFSYTFGYVVVKSSLSTSQEIHKLHRFLSKIMFLFFYFFILTNGNSSPF